MNQFLLILLSALLGWVAGVLANWAADTWPHWRTLPAKDRFPHDLSAVAHVATAPWYLATGGICPHCHVKRTWRAPVVEAGMILLFAGSAFFLSSNLAYLFVAWLYGWYLVVVAVIDLETRRVLNIMTAVGAIVAIAVSATLKIPPLPSSLAGGIVAFLLFFALYWIGRAMFGRGALGLGDVKLVGVIGLMTGYPQVLTALLVGSLLGGAVGIYLIATHRAKLKSTGAYAPFLVAGALFSLWSTLAH